VFDIAALIPNVSKDIVIQSYGLDIPLVLAMQINMWFVKSADRILCMSNYTKKDLTSILGIDNRRIIVGYPGIDRAQFRPRDKMKVRQKLGLPLNRRIILHVGTDEPRKNTKTLIQAFRRIKKSLPDTILVKVGGMRETTRRLIMTLGLLQSVLYYRKVPNIELYYNAADILLFPSYYEGFGYPVAEAMASGCPVIAGDSSSVTEVVGKAGLLFPPFDVVTLHEMTIQALTDSSMSSVMIKEGLEQVKKFDWTKCAETTLEAYETL
jgi:alpha-1,3-rhamnosyl/mannosyltransferase